MSNDASSLNRQAALASIGAASVLLLLKGWASWSTHSSAMLGSLADTGLDLLASVATLIAVWIAAQPADDKHRFGHGKAEAISALFQIVLISISALGIASHSLRQFWAGGRVETATTGIGVSVASIVVTVLLVAWQRYVVRKTGSLAIATDSAHYQSDLLLNASVIAALVLDYYAGWAGIDPFFGFGIALWLGWGAYGASRHVINQLMDREWPDEKKRRFLEIVARHPAISGAHDMRTRTSGDKDFVQFHVWVDGDMSVRNAHVVMDELEAQLHAVFPDVEILIHPDPIGHTDAEGAVGPETLPPL